MIPSLDHVERGIARLTDWRQTTTRVTVGLVTSVLNRVQELENALWEIYTLRRLEDAEGRQLDILGKIVGRGRNGLSDPHYLLAIKAQIRINRSQGLAIDVIEVALLSVPEGVFLKYWEPGPAHAVIEVGPGDYDLATFVRNVKAAKAVATKLTVVTFEDTDRVFRWSSVAGGAIVADALHGWSTAADTSIGGRWAHAI